MEQLMKSLVKVECPEGLEVFFNEKTLVPLGTTSWGTFQNLPEASRRFQNLPEASA